MVKNSKIHCFLSVNLKEFALNKEIVHENAILFLSHASVPVLKPFTGIYGNASQKILSKNVSSHGFSSKNPPTITWAPNFMGN